MRQLLLLVQSQSDVEALPTAAAAIKPSYEGVWLLFSPAVLVDSKTASAEHDANIAALQAAIDRCKATEDFDGAKGYKVQRDDAVLQKTVKVKEAWKTLTQAQQDTATERVFGSFVAALGIPNLRVESMQDHYEPSQFIAALNARKPAWFAPYVPGTFTIAWATSFVEESKEKRAVAPIPEVVKTVPEPVEPKERALLPTQHPRFKELVNMGLDLGQHAMTLGLNPNTFKNILAMRHAVFKKEKEMGKIQ